MDVFKDKSWVKLRRVDNTYKRTLDTFLDYAFATSVTDGNKIACPCSTCANRFYHERNVVRGHLIMREMDIDYQRCVWIFHGEQRGNEDNENFDLGLDDDMGFDDVHDGSCDDVLEMVGDIFEFHRASSSCPGSNEEADAFFKLIEDAGQPLYPGCEAFSKLSFIVEMYHLKCLYGVTDVAFDALVKLFKRALPKESTLPNSHRQMQGIIKKLGLGYEKIDACPNDCALFRKEKIDLDNCPICNALRWKVADDGTVVKLASGKKVPLKVLRHFPLIPRLKRLFMSSKTAPLMRWHEEERKKDGKLRHLADSYLWKDFDSKYPEFASDSRNVRLGLTSDGFNPFGMMSTQYSIWPVVLMVYNLPPWLCMKQSYFILSLLIPGPKAPGNDIDVFLEPLVDELKELWDVGLETYDASKNETFSLHGALINTINDFPAYGNLSGWKTKGKIACPHCNIDTCSEYLRGSKKMCYMGHRRFLDSNHRFRRSRRAFDGKTELRPPPTSFSGTDLLYQMDGIDVIFGKAPYNKRRREDKKRPWKKRSIFFQLPYWEHLLLRHSLDMMHVEKNVSENLLGTLLGIEGRTKDTLQSRLDLQVKDIRHDLHPIEIEDKIYLPPACFTLTQKEKEEILSILGSVKVPDGYAANIRRRIVDGKISGLKSHDHHIIMQQLLPLALRKMRNKDVSKVLIELSNCFKELCSKDATTQDLEILEDRIALTLCHMERIFLPSFFDIMVHLVVHLPKEAIIAGPVFYRWMYPVERYLRRLKMYVRNKSRPEGSIAEGYIAEECLTFCSRYLPDVPTKENRSTRNDDDDGNELHNGLPIFSLKSRAMSKKKDVQPEYMFIEEAHSYVLANCDEVDVFAQEHYDIIRTEYQQMSNMIDDIHRRKFPKWFAMNVIMSGLEKASSKKKKTTISREQLQVSMSSLQKALSKKKVTQKSQGQLEEVIATTSRSSKFPNEEQSIEAIGHAHGLKKVIAIDPSTYSSIKQKLFTPMSLEEGSQRVELGKRHGQEFSCSKINSLNEVIEQDPSIISNADICKRHSPSRIQSINVSSIIEVNDGSQTEHAISDGYFTTNRRRFRGTMPRNEKGRGCNKTKVLKKAEYVDVNEHLQPISDSARQLSTLIGCLARDPRRLPLDCWDWRKMDRTYLDSIWEEAKISYYFPENREPYKWALGKIHEAWRAHKSELKVVHFDGKTHNQAIQSRPKEIPESMWLEMVKFWESPKGKERSQRGILNRAKSKMCSYAGSKSFARIRAEEKEKMGKEPDELEMWLKTHEPKKGYSKLNDASAATRKAILDEMTALPEGCDANARREIFKKVVGEDRNGYAKTFGLGVKVPRSHKRRCAFEEERAKRIKSESRVEKLEKDLLETKEQVGYLTGIMHTLLENQGKHVDNYYQMEDDENETDDTEEENEEDDV